MTGANRILKVSYGTFSCTLEGFDDPLSTLQAVAEYFRGIAADDRYFGAAPLTPDASVLHRIAEQAVNRRVEARIEDNSMILRTDEAMQAAMSPAPTAPWPASQPEPQPAATGLLAEESVAAKLQRIRAAVARDEEPADGASSFIGEDAAAVAAVPPAFSAGTEDDVTAGTGVAPDEAWGPAQEAAGTDSAAGPPEWPVALGGADGDHGEPVDLRTEWTADDAPEPGEPAPDAALPEGLTGGQADSAAPLFTSLADFPDRLPEARPGPTAEDLPEAAGAEDGDLPTSLHRAWAEARASFARDAAAPSGPARTAAVADSAPDTGNGPPAPSAPWDATGFASSWQDVLSAFQGLSQRTLPASNWPSDPDLPAPAEADTEPSAMQDSRGGETQQAVLLHAAEPFADPASAGPEAPLAAQSGSGNGAGATGSTEGRIGLDDGTESVEDDAWGAEDATPLLRLPTTETEDSENRRRMLAMAHLKAAVAAAMDTDLQPAGEEDQSVAALPQDGDDVYPDFVGQSDRPDVPTPPDRPEPLVLVSEQRIDRTLPDGAVILSLQQRITRADPAVADAPDDSGAPAGAEDAFAPALSFSRFAQQVGAGEMPDLLEAAAAYTVCIEKQPHFTRPHLMRHVADATGTGEANREDAMRNFGLLLRQGKIAKADDGLFAVTESCTYLAQARRMAR
ncbi:MAG: hypothetical protein IOC80_02285 [Rhodobacter sp.]|nr:hypothetical protein [Rhodobacter sp.]MCA3514009.1 hypothetical protein [Rhodobacter sp.]MCA3521245.1 hypothetical protein [Rhodobacter sp.]MCA3523087.1 hypothetical protein [Rhodobacter sp.]MCA3525081.1 hypothetical protein [Rhodobacter sp.]